MSLLWKCRDRRFELGDGQPPLVMGILNVTPDSFSDGGRFSDSRKAVEHGLRMLGEGADIIDVGGESTRPGAKPADLEEELSRVVPVVKELVAAEAVVSVDTRKAVVAERALACGAHIVNDVSAMTADSGMAGVVKSFGAGAILMHMAGEPETMQDNPSYDDVVCDIRNYLDSRIEELAGAGVDREAMAVDPGIGFGKTTQHNIKLIRNIRVFRESGRPVVMGLSRKRMLGEITGRDVADRLAAGLGALSYALVMGMDIARVHDVKASRDALLVVKALIQQERGDRCNG